MAKQDSEKVLVRRYKRRGDRRNIQAQRLWMLVVASVLCYQREHGRTPTEVVPASLPTYGELAVLMGYSPQAGRTFATAIGMIGWLCLENDLPPLNAVVVNRSRLPGDEVVLSGTPKTDAEWVAQVRKDQLAVLRFDWTTVRPPSTGMMLRIAKKHGMYASRAG